MARFQSTVLTTMLLGALLGTPVPALAHGGGGGHGGGGHAGGGHAGVGHAGGYGGYHGGYYHGGYGYGYGGFYPGYGYGIGYRGYGYGYGGIYPAYSGVNPIYLNTTVTPVVVGTVPAVLSSGDPGLAPEPPPPNDNKAHIRVILPANAVLWFGGEATAQTGAQRDFVSPELPLDKTYTYEIKARWMQGGQPVERALQVKVRRNQASVADFNQIPPPKD